MQIPEHCRSTPLPREALAGRVARRAVHEVLGDAPITPVRDALLLTSELVTNAIRHTTGGVTLTTHFWPTESRLRVEVADESDRVPHLPARAHAAAEGGRGLRLVDDLSASWGSQIVAGGKCMWFEVSW